MIFKNFPKDERRSIRCFHSLPQTVLSFLLLFLLVLPATVDAEAVSGGSDEVVIEALTTSPPVFYEPNNKKDPFLNLVSVISMPFRVKPDAEIPRGTPPPGIAGTSIDRAGLEGIVFRGNNQRTAIILDANNRAHFLGEGDRLFDGYVKAIEIGSVVFIRETFMRSGRILTQEVTKQLRKS